eukprot:GILJ01002060.1.p1 GENE.GILJ01002060.1~~GILJ01002060.1.p1  ORF type:complete len:312 (+),score=67.54 GILJ01002060.1:93-1028(+)
MSRGQVISFVVCFALLASVCVASDAVPTLLWSGKSHFDGVNKQHVNHMNSAELLQALHALGTNSQHAALNSAELRTKPEIVTIFLKDNLRTDDLVRGRADSFEALKSLMQQSSSSLSIPYCFREQALSLRDMLPAHSAQVLIASDAAIADSALPGHVSTTSLKDLLVHLRSQSAFASNGATNYLILDLDSAADKTNEDALVRELSSLLHEMTSGNYVGVYTAKAAADSIVASSGRQLLSLKAKRAAAQASMESRVLLGETSTKKSVTPQILSSLLIGAMLLLLLLIGIMNLSQVQTPTRMASESLVLGKEY